ncbi:MAG: helix-turn-helix domain-containing protein [bacterium]|nr:helix-turn-helix domain-containing protein [bacterium]
MGQITSLFVRKVIREVDPTVDKDSLLRSVGIEPDSPIDPSHMVSDTEYYAFLERIAEVDKTVTTLPLRVGAAMRCDDYGAFGLAWKSATNLRGSYERAERYARMLTSVSTHEVETTDNGAFMHLHRCPVYFESDRDALLVSTETLHTPNQLGDASISKFFDTHLEAELSKIEDDASLDQRVRIQISQALSEGVPAISDVASHLSMSGRTLQRRLADRGYSYQTLVDESRRQLAKRLLQQTDYSLVEVAFMTGFSEQSAFTRAFRRWEGQTPRSFRIDSQPKPQ